MIHSTREQLEAHVRGVEEELAALRAGEERFRRITRALTDYIYTVQVQHGIPVSTIHEPGCVAVTGYAPEDFVRNPFLWIEMVPEDHRDMVRAHADSILAGQSPGPLEHCIIRKDGRTSWVKNTPAPRFLNGALVSYDGIVSDITERKLAEQTIRESEGRYRALFNSSPQAITILDLDGRIIDLNPAAALLAAINRNQAAGMHFTELNALSEESLREYSALFDSLLQGCQPGAYTACMVNAIGVRLWTENHVSLLTRDTEIIGFQIISTDITERKHADDALARYHEILEELVRERTAELTKLNDQLKQEIQERRRAEEQVRRLALHDSLTELPNRHLLFDRIRHALHMADRNGTSVATLFVDLDGFKAINDEYGHETGDHLLREVASRLCRCVRKSDTIARYGGDEFIVVLENLQDINYSEVVAGKILHALNRPFSFRNQTVIVGASVGISLFPQDGRDTEELLRYADRAMYAVKNRGKNDFSFFAQPQPQA